MLRVDRRPARRGGGRAGAVRAGREGARPARGSSCTPVGIGSRKRSAEARSPSWASAAQGQLRGLVRLRPIAADVPPVAQDPARRLIFQPVLPYASVQWYVSGTVHSVSWWTLLLRGRPSPPSTSTMTSPLEPGPVRGQRTDDLVVLPGAPAELPRPDGHLPHRAAEVPLQDQLLVPLVDEDLLDAGVEEDRIASRRRKRDEVSTCSRGSNVNPSVCMSPTTQLPREAPAGPDSPSCTCSPRSDDP